MQPTDSAKDAPVLRGFRLPSDQSADPSRETATSFDSQPPEANKPHQIPPLNPVLNQSNDRNGDNGLAELKGFRLGDFENSREAAVSFAAVYRSDSLIPNVQTGSKSSDVPAPRPLKSPPDQLRKRANPDPPVLKGFRLAPDEAHARDPAVGFYRGSSPGTEESSGSTALSPSSVGVSSSSSQPPTRNGSAQAPKQGGDLETPVLRGFRLPDGGPSSPPTRDAAVSFDGPPSPAVISHRSLLRPVTEDPASAPDVGLSIVLTADSPSNPSLRNSYSSPKTRNPGTASPANRAITNQGEGLGGLPKGRLTWNDVINGASEEDVDARTGKGLSEAGADGAADADCGGETDDVSDRGGGTEGEVCKRVVAEGDEVTLAARARKGGGDDITTVEVGPLSESRSGRTDVKLTANAERGVPKGVPASGGKLEVEHEGGLNGGGGMEEDGMERLQRNSSESRRPGETTGRSAGIIGGDWHEEGEVSTQLTRGTGTGHKVMGEDGTGITPGERDWSRPELKGLQRSPDGKGPDLRPQKEWTDSHNDVNEPVISAARAFSPKAKAPALGSPFRDEGVHFGREASRSPSFERLPSFSDREGSEVVSAAKAFSPKGGGRTRLGLPASHETEGIGGKSGQQDIDGEEHEAHKKADGNVESNVEIAATPESGGLQASNESGETALSLAEKSTGAAIESSGGDRGQGSVGGADGKEQRTGVLKSGAKPGTVGEESGKRVLKGGILEGEGKDSEKEPSQRGSEVAEPVLASETVLPMGEPESKHNAAPFAAKAPAAPKGPGERPRPKRRPRKPEDNGPVADTRASETPDGLTLLAAQYEDLPPPRGPPAKPVQATRLLPREEASKADGDVEVVVDRGEEPRRHNGGPESGSPAAERTQRDANPPEKHSQPEPRLVESGVENRGRTGEALDGSSNTLQIGTEWPRKQKQLRPRPPDTTPESPPEVRESGASRKQATKPSNPISAPPSIPLVRSGERGLTQQQNANPPAEHLSRPRDSENAAAGKSRPGPEESGGVTNQANLRPVKTSRPASSGQQRPRSQPLSPTPATKPPPTSKAPASDAAAQQAVRNSSDDPEPLRAPELSVSPRIVPTNRPKPQTAPAAGSTPRKVPRGNDVASCPPSDNPQASDASPKALPRSSHVVLSLPAGSDTPRSSDAPPADPYLLSEPYKPSTYGDPARPASGGRPLTAERPPSAGSARYTYSERPVSAERWVAPSESETLTHLPNPSENLPENYARAFPTEMGHVLPLQFSGTPPTLGHVAAPHWPLALGPDGQFVRSSSEGFGAVASLNPHGLPPFLDPHQQLQAQFMQQYPGVSFAPPGLANPYGNPLSRPENAPPTHSYAPGLSHPTAQSQEFPHPQSQPQNGLNQTPFAHLQGALNPFGSFPNPGLQYSPFSHPYFPYGIPPPFYTQTPPMFPFASASGPLNQTLQTGTMQGVPFAGTLVPPPEPRPTSRQGLDRSVSSRSELLKARDIAIQRAQERASKKEALAAVASQPVTKPPESKANPRSELNPVKPASTGPTNGAKLLAASAPRSSSQTRTSKSRGPSEVSQTPEVASAEQQPGRVIASDVIPSSAVPPSQRQRAGQLRTDPSVNPSVNPPNNPLPNPGPNPPYIPAHLSQAAAETLPSYDDFLEFLRFRSAVAAQAPGVLTSASALAAAFSPAPHHATPSMGGMQTSANPLGRVLTSAIPHNLPPAGLSLVPSEMSPQVAQAGLLTSATARARAVADHQELTSAARTIQTLWREHKLSKRERRLREAPERRAGMLLTWHCRARFLHLRRVAVFLQSLRRGVLARRRFWATRKAVRIIQSAWKLFRASLSSWQRGKLRELRDFHRYVRENLEVVGLEAPSFRKFARLMERLSAATEGARVRRRLRGRKANALVNEMRDIRDLLQQLEAEKARGGATPDRQLEKTLRVQLRQKHVLLERAAHTPLLSSSPSTVNTPLPSPHPSSAGFGPGQSSSGRDLGRSGVSAGDFGRNPGSFGRNPVGYGRNPDGFGRDQRVPDALRAWASSSVGGRPEEGQRSSNGNDGAGRRVPRSTFEENEALAAAHAESARSSFASGGDSSRAFSHQGGARRVGAPVVESNRISFRGASVGFGNVPPPVADRAGGGRAFVADESAAGTFEEFAGPVFRTFDEGLSLSPVRMNSPPAKSRVTTAGRAGKSLRGENRGSAQTAREPGESASETGHEKGSIEFEDVPYDSDSDGVPDAVGMNRYPVSVDQKRFVDNRPGPRRQGKGAYEVEDLARASASANRSLPGEGSQTAASQRNGSSANPAPTGRLPNRVSYDDIPITASATPRHHPDLHVDVPSRSNPPSQNPSPSENSGRGPAKRPFLRARSGRLGTSFTIPDHLKLSFNETPRGASEHAPSGATVEAPGGSAGPALDSAELGPSTAPGNLGRSLFADGHRVKRRVKRNPLEAEISILEKDEEGEESEEPPKRAFLQRKSKAMPMQKLDWSKVKSLVEARLDPEKFAATSRAGAPKKDEPPPLPDYKNVKSRLLAYREPNKKYPSVEEEPSFEPGDQAPLSRLPRSPRSKPGKSRARNRKRSGSKETFDDGKRNGHVAARDRTDQVMRSNRGVLGGPRKEAWASGDETDSEARSLGSQNRRAPRKVESRKKRKGDKTSVPGKFGRGAAGRSHQEGSEEEPGEDEFAGQGGLSSAGELLERMYGNLQRDGGVEFSSLFPRRRGGESVIPRLRGDEDIFSDQGNSLYSRLTRESQFDRLELGRLTFVAASAGSATR